MGVETDAQTGLVTAIRCTFDPDTKRGGSQASRKVKGTIHWVSVAQAIPAEVRLYEALLAPSPLNAVCETQDLPMMLNPNSLNVLPTCWVEPSLGQATKGSRFQFERQGYFCLDPDSNDSKLVFNRTVSLRDSWAKMEKK